MFCLDDFCARSPMTKQGAMVLPIVTGCGSAHLCCTGFGSWQHRGRSLQAAIRVPGITSQVGEWSKSHEHEIAREKGWGRLAQGLFV